RDYRETMIAIKHCIVNEQSRKQVVIRACLKLYIKDTIIALILAFKNLICPHGWPDDFNIKCFLLNKYTGEKSSFKETSQQHTLVTPRRRHQGVLLTYYFYWPPPGAPARSGI